MGRLTVGSLFSGIGVIDLGLERAGMEVLWQAECEPYARNILRKHWPAVPKLRDVRDATLGRVERPDVLAGGFPCQDISVAGRGAGIGGEKSGLWREFARCVRDFRPRYVLVENSPALRSRGLGDVLGDLAAIGYDAEWDCIPADSVGAPHERDRIFVIAYPGRSWRYAGELPLCECCAEPWCPECSAHFFECEHPGPHEVPNADGERCEERRRASPVFSKQPALERGGWWSAEPGMVRVAYGLPNQVERIQGLGNAVVPAVAEFLGRLIMEDAARGL